MASLFRNSTVRKGKRKVYPTWYGSYIDEDGKWAKVKLYTDKTASQRRLNEIQAEAEQRRAGVRTRIMDHAQKSILEHLAEYKSDLEGQRVTAMHLRNANTRLTEIIRLGEWKRLADISADSMRHVLTSIAKRPIQGAKKTEKNPPALSTSTVNSFLRVARAFVHWLVERGRLNGDPLAVLKKADESKAVKRRARRALSPDEIIRLLAAAPANRSDVYKFIMLTGLRRSEARFLLVGDLHLDATRPFVQLRTQQTKNGQADQLPIHAELVTMLRSAIAGKMPGARVFKAIPEVRTLEKDLAVAKVAFVDELGRRVDLHAQRHTYCTLVANSGASLKTAQTLMRHADPRLTANVYAHVGIFDTAGAMANVTLPGSDRDAKQAKTGTTDDATDPRWKPIGKSAFPTVRKVAQHGTTNSGGAEVAGSIGSDTEDGQNSGNDTQRHDMAQHGLNEIWNAANVPDRRPHSSVGYQETPPAPSKTPQSRAVGNRLETDPDLAKVIAAWPRLPKNVKQSILGVVAMMGGAKA